MIFGFSDIEYKQYNKNFLKTVVFQIAFDRIKNFSEKKSEIIDAFIKQFPRITTPSGAGIEISFKNSQTPIVQHIKNEDTIEFKSENGQKVLLVTNSSLSFTISGKEYKCYNNLKEDITKINEFFRFCEIKELNRLAIRKINIVDFKYEDNGSEILNSLINPNLIGNPTYYPSSEFIKQNMHSLNYKKGVYTFNIKYGLNIPQTPVQNIGQLIIDLDLFNTAKIQISEIFNIADGINKEIFNAFNWIANENLLTLLNE